MTWAELPFGKYIGKILPQVLFEDPDYFFWAYERRTVFREILGAEAAELYRKATRIRIPSRHGEGFVAQYIAHPVTGRFVALDLVPRSTVDRGSPCIDLSVPRQMREYDKTGCKLLVKTVKEIFFGSAGVRMTAKRSAQFFEDQANFLP